MTIEHGKYSRIDSLIAGQSHKTALLSPHFSHNVQNIFEFFISDKNIQARISICLFVPFMAN